MMPASLPSLWPEDIAVDVLTPLAVLKAQASEIGPLTKGILEAQVITASDSDRLTHKLELIAPALNGLRREVLTVFHGKFEPYPVTLDAVCFLPHDPDHFDPQEDYRPVAATYEDFVTLLRRVFRSEETRALLQSLIALTNEAKFSAV